MLPLRISLQGFMSYRDATTFDFEGARLWMLAGENGAGKSTVFDALRWVLFGVHRGGKQKPEQLIHHESQKLMVEVELRLGEALYKLRRTLGREGVRPTWDVSRRVEGAWESVAGTSMAREYDKWVEDHIGLTDEAFCASVYLSQGKADAILNADADARYELLSQLVDLEVYERWHERADERRIDARAAMIDARKRWETAPLPALEQLADLRERGAHLEAEHTELEEKVRELEGARGDAARWEEWSAQIGVLEREAVICRALLQEEASIERDFTRLRHLNQHRAAVNSLWQQLSRRDELAQKIERLKPQQAVAEHNLKEAQQGEHDAQSASEEAERTWTRASDIWSAHVHEVGQLAPQRAVIERRGQLLEQREKSAGRLASFEPDVEAQLERAQREREEAREAARALPLWRRFAEAQRAYLKARAQRQTWQERHDEAVSIREGAEANAQAARVARRAAEAILREAVAAVGGVDERARALEQRCADFAQVEGEARCHFCGQELSPQHRAAELERLALTAATLEGEQQRAQIAYETARVAFQGAEKAVVQTANVCAETERTIAAADTERHHQSSNMAREHSIALVAWDELGAQEHCNLGWGDTAVESIFAADASHPDEADLKRLETMGGRVKALESSVIQWEQRLRERVQVMSELARLDEGLTPLLREWSDEAVEVWQTRAQRLESELGTFRSQLEESRARLDSAREHQSRANQSVNEARTLSEELVRQLGPLQGELTAIESGLKVALPMWNTATEREAAALPTLEVALTLRDAWEHQTSELEGRDTETRYLAMGEARDKLAGVEREHAFYRLQIEALPPVARRARVEVETDWRDTRALLQNTEAGRVQVGDEVRRLEREAKERIALEAEHHERTLQHERWEELARLLGPHQLQRHLLRQAESAIVREANGVLETISGGTLQLELVPDSDESGGNRRPKVLDVMCFHLSGGEDSKAIAPVFLSGSQRFRVAVALALGIGRTAARGSSNGRAARVETILIDEGFGSLDKVGRDEMKDELRALGRELGRVILVSHQEDFARAFPNRFNISMENGVSRMQKVVE